MLKKIITDDPKLKALLADRVRRAGLSTQSNKGLNYMSQRSPAVREFKIEGSQVQPAFSTLGKFLQAVHAASIEGNKTDAKLIRAPHGVNETDEIAGGFLVPTQFEKELIFSIYEESNLAQLCDRRETDKPSNWKLPAIDETSRADGSRWGGTLSYWTGEAVQPAGSLPRYKLLELPGKRLIALATATRELIADAPLLEGYIRRAFASEIAFKLDLAILRGTGFGTPTGIVAAPGTIQIAKTVGQAAGTIVAENIASMWSALASPCRKRAVWICNEDAESQLELLGTASTNGMYYPAGANGNEFALVKGRPLIVSEVAPTLGTPGDIVLADLSQYILIDGGMQTNVSMDISFDTDESVFRFRWRGDGKPAWATPITPYNSTQPRSAFVTLAQR